jgi:electron transport complex protein RnfE
MSAKLRAREVSVMNNGTFGETLRRGVITNNPILFQIMGVCPVVAIALSVKTASVVAGITAVELIIIEILSSLLLKNIRRHFRVLIYAVLGFAINLPLFILVGKLYPEISESIGIFLPLLAVNSVIAVKCETFAVKNTVKDTLVDSVATAIGYGIVTMAVGAAREALGSGTFAGKSLSLPYTAEAFLMPFGGFLLLGFFAAVVKGLTAKKHSEEVNASMLDTSQIRMLHIKHLKQLIDESEDDDIFFDDSVLSDLEPKQSVFRKKQKTTAPERTIVIPTEIQSGSEEPQEKKPTGYQPFADLLKTLETHEPELVTEATEPEPDPLELNEDWEVQDEELLEVAEKAEETSDEQTEGGDGQ